MKVSTHCHPLPQSFHRPEHSIRLKSARTLRERLILKRHLRARDSASAIISSFPYPTLPLRSLGQQLFGRLSRKLLSHGMPQRPECCLPGSSAHAVSFRICSMWQYRLNPARIASTIVPTGNLCHNIRRRRFPCFVLLSVFEQPIPTEDYRFNASGYGDIFRISHRKSNIYELLFTPYELCH